MGFRMDFSIRQSQMQVLTLTLATGTLRKSFNPVDGLPERDGSKQYLPHGVEVETHEFVENTQHSATCSVSHCDDDDY